MSRLRSGSTPRREKPDDATAVGFLVHRDTSAGAGAGLSEAPGISGEGASTLRPGSPSKGGGLV
jgi:hypothetical protein